MSRSRFENLTSGILGDIPKLDPQNWVGSDDDYDCNKVVDELLQAFKPILIENGCDIDNAKREWVKLKKTVDDLMLICLTGPSIEDFNASSAVCKWLGAAVRRLNIKPYGPRQG